MGARKHNTAEAMKEARKEQYFAKLNNVPTSPRKMRLVADMIRGMEVNRALGALHFSTREASRAMEKVLKSAIANWETKTGKKADKKLLYVAILWWMAYDAQAFCCPSSGAADTACASVPTHITCFRGY